MTEKPAQNRRESAAEKNLRSWGHVATVALGTLLGSISHSEGAVPSEDALDSPSPSTKYEMPAPKSEPPNKNFWEYMHRKHARTTFERFKTLHQNLKDIQKYCGTKRNNGASANIDSLPIDAAFLKMLRENLVTFYKTHTQSDVKIAVDKAPASQTISALTEVTNQLQEFVDAFEQNKDGVCILVDQYK